MSSNISASDVRNVHIFGKRDRDLDLCRTHRDHLRDDISEDINDLVATTLFQAHFRDFLPPNDDEESDVNIHVTENSITVSSLTSRKTKTIELDTLSENISEVEDINAEIIEKANAAYRACMDDDRRSSRSHHSLRGRASTRDAHEHRQARSVSPVSRRHTRSLSPVSRRHAHTLSPAPGRQTHRSDDSSRRDHDISLKAQARLAREQAERLRSQAASNPRLAEKLARVEEKLRTLEQKLGIVSPAVPTELEARIDALFDRLGGIETKVDILKAPRPDPVPSTAAPQSSEELLAMRSQLDRLNAEKAQLESQLGQVKGENEVLKARLITPPIDIADDHFDRLIEISDGLSLDINKNSTLFPGDLQAEFNLLPEKIRNAIYYQTYLLVDPSGLPNPWQVGEKLFQGQPVHGADISAHNLCRAHAIRYFLLHSLATEFAKTPGDEPNQKLLERFNRLPEDERRWVLIQMQFIQQRKGSDDTHKSANDAFYGVEGKTATNQERSGALVRSLLERVAEYHRHNFQTQIKELEHVYREAFEQFQAHTSLQIQTLSAQNSALEQQLTRATSSLRSVELERDQLRDRLAVQTLELSKLQERFDQANEAHRLQVDRLTVDVRQGSDALALLKREKDEAAQQHLLAETALREQVAQGTDRIRELELQGRETERLHTDQVRRLSEDVRQGTQRIAQLEQQGREAAERNRIEVERLNLQVQSGGVEIRDLKQQALLAAEQHRLQIDALRSEVRTKTDRVSELEQQGRDTAELHRKKVEGLETDVREGVAALEQLRRQKDLGDEQNRQKIEKLDETVRQGSDALALLKREKDEAAQQHLLAETALREQVAQGTDRIRELELQGRETERLHTDQVRRLSEDVRQGTQRIAQLEQQGREAAERNRIEVERLNLQVQSGGAEIRDLKQQALLAADQHRLQIDALRSEVKTKTDRVSELEQQGRDTAELHRKKVEGLETDVREGVAALEQLRRQKDLGDEQNRLRIEKLDETVRQGSVALALLKREKDEAAQQHLLAETALRKDIKQGAVRIEDLERQAQNDIAQIRSLGTQVSELTEHLREAESKVRNLEQQKERMVDELEVIGRKLAVEERKTEALGRQLLQATQERDAAVEAQVKLTAEIERQKERIGTLNGSNIRLKAELEIARKQQLATLKDIQESEQQLDLQRKANAQLRQQLELERETKEQLGRDFAREIRELTEAQKRKDASHVDQLRLLREQAGRDKDQISRLEVQVEDGVANLAAAQRKEKAFTEENRAQALEIEELIRTQKNLEVDKRRVEEEASVLNRALEEHRSLLREQEEAQLRLEESLRQTAQRLQLLSETQKLPEKDGPGANVVIAQREAIDLAGALQQIGGLRIALRDKTLVNSFNTNNDLLHVQNILFYPDKKELSADWNSAAHTLKTTTKRGELSGDSVLIQLDTLRGELASCDIAKLRTIDFHFDKLDRFCTDFSSTCGNFTRLIQTAQQELAAVLSLSNGTPSDKIKLIVEGREEPDSSLSGVDFTQARKAYGDMKKFCALKFIPLFAGNPSRQILQVMILANLNSQIVGDSSSTYPKALLQKAVAFKASLQQLMQQVIVE